MRPLSRQEALSYAIKRLSERPRTKAHLITLLKRRGVRTDDQEAIVRRLTELGLLDDKALAEQLRDSITREGPSGKRRIWRVLRRRKVPSEIASEVVRGIDEETESKDAREAVLMMADKWQDLEPRKRKKRLYDFLIRRGFPYEICRDAIDEAL